MPSSTPLPNRIAATDSSSVRQWYTFAELYALVGLYLEQLTDVTITSPTNGQVLTYQSGIWVNQSVSSGSGTVTSVDLTSGTGISVSGGPITTSGSILVTNTAPDQTVVLNNGTGITISGTYPNFTITNTSPSTVVPAALTKTDDTNVTLTLGGTPATSLLQSVSLTLGWTGTLADSRITSATNWNTAYTNRITSLTTTGASGSATLISNVLNIPTYTLAGLGGISLTSLSSIAPISYNNTTGVFSITQSTTSTDGYLSSTDWNIFNNKQASGNYITALTGDVTASGPGSVASTIASNAVTYAKMQAVSTTSKLLGSSSTTTPIQEITIGSGLSLSGTTLTATGGGGSGTVTSVTSADGNATVATTTTTPVITIVSAPKLQTARTINGVSFDGTGNITITAVPSAYTGMVESISLNDIGSAIPAQTYTLELYAEYGYTINELKIISTSGTCTAALKINGTNVTGISATSVSSTIATGTASAANTVVVGDKVTLVISSNSSLVNLQATIKYTRT